MPTPAITGTGLYRPPHVITNAELVEAFNAYADAQDALHGEAIARGEREPLARSSVEFIEKASGVRQRYVIEKSGVLDPARMRPRLQARRDDELSLMAEIAADAARSALAAARCEAAEVDMVVCAASNMQRPYPAMAVEIQQALGCGGYGFDMNVACSSATFAFAQAASAVRAGDARRVLIVNPEITSGHLEWTDRDCHFIFGDVCTATVIEDAQASDSPERWEVVGTRCATHYANAIRNNFGFLNRSEDADPLARDKTFRQEGRKVFKDVVPLAAAHIEQHLEALGLEPTHVRRYWLHQANLGMNQLILKRLVGSAAGPDVAPLVLDTYANTASAGSVIAFHEHRADLAAGDTGVLCSFGAGYSVGSVVLRKL